MKLKSKRTGKEFKVLKINDSNYTVKLENGETKELAVSTVKRWYEIIEEPVKKPEPKKVDSELVKKEKPRVKRKRGVSNQDFKVKVASVIKDYVHSLDLKLSKRKEYFGAYTTGKKKVVEIKSTRKGLRVSVRPMVYLSLTEKERQRCLYLNEKCNLHFRTTFEITSTQDLDLAKKLIKLSLKDLEG